MTSCKLNSSQKANLQIPSHVGVRASKYEPGMGTTIQSITEKLRHLPKITQLEVMEPRVLVKPGNYIILPFKVLYEV